ncbi:RNase P [Heterobasidion irregulare TC 32-1]|uniref:Ribonuclease P/MRP protein subunit POP5 n=1 Tax=Heterobasidion irregulare (strain TC 32-1) TaxID=747525 RepID=W4KA49_HETIT|nr:RNase P [Heterobasidion irregulare TC 32-1]ETW82624.1 RNase P [Heterobasidion irregulare TC 32-1]
MVRFKNRWILVEFLPAPGDPEPTRGAVELTGKHVWAALRQSVIAHFGDTGWGAVGASLSVKYFSPTTNLCIVRVAREPYRIAWAAATLLSSIEGRPCIPNVVHVSGTIKHAQLAAIEHNRTVIARYRAKANTPAAYQDSYASYLETSTQEIESLQD